MYSESNIQSEEHKSEENGVRSDFKRSARAELFVLGRLPASLRSAILELCWFHFIAILLRPCGRGEKEPSLCFSWCIKNGIN
jgi:hypothetical protein